jgi:hypothetical protein
MGKTFIYLCRTGNNEELRYSIRSVMTFYPDATIWVVGGKPDWYVGNYIPVDQGSNAFNNVRNNLSKIIKNKSIPDEVIIMNDDFFFIKPVEDIKFYASGTLENKILMYDEFGVSTSYVNRLIDLERHCRKFRKPPLDFELHVPMPVNKQKLSKVVNENVMWRSNYANRFADEFQIEFMDDVKVYPKGQYDFKNYNYLSLQYPFVSTQDTSFAEVSRNLLRKMFPTKTIHESI